MWYVIRKRGTVRVEQDRHVLGLFPVQTWVGLMEDAGFAVEKDSYDVHEGRRQAWLLVGTLRDYPTTCPCSLT